MSETDMDRALIKQIVGGIIIAACSAVLSYIIFISAANTKRDVDIGALQTTVSNMNERLTQEHEEYVKQLAAIEAQMRQVQIDVARISEKVGVYASPGVK